MVREQLSRVVLAQGPLVLELRVSHSKACLGPEEVLVRWLAPSGSSARGLLLRAARVFS